MMSIARQCGMTPLLWKVMLSLEQLLGFRWDMDWVLSNRSCNHHHTSERIPIEVASMGDASCLWLYTMESGAISIQTRRLPFAHRR
jgi:hypothetical protein